MTALRTTLGMLWFSAMFFAAFPALVLWAVGSSPIARVQALGAGGWAALGLAAALLAWQTTHFVRAGNGTPIPLDPPRRLVAEGPYRLCRNPIYVFYTIVILVEAAVLGSGALVAYAAGFALLAHFYVVAVEEPGLRARFGPDYERYCAEVPRWLPDGQRRLLKGDAEGLAEPQRSPSNPGERSSLPVGVSGSAATTRNSRGTL